MQPIKYLKGDATAPNEPGPKIIAHVCNDVGAWGRGFVLALSARWPEPEADYRKWHRELDGKLVLGSVQYVQVAPGILVANMIGQSGIAPVDGVPPVRYSAIGGCLSGVAAIAIEHGASVHMPRIGCGLAGGTWDRIEPLIEQQLAAEDVRVFIYDLA